MNPQAKLWHESYYGCTILIPPGKQFMLKVSLYDKDGRLVRSDNSTLAQIVSVGWPEEGEEHLDRDERLSNPNSTSSPDD